MRRPGIEAVLTRIEARIAALLRAEAQRPRPEAEPEPYRARPFAAAGATAWRAHDRAAERRAETRAAARRAREADAAERSKLRVELAAEVLRRRTLEQRVAATQIMRRRARQDRREEDRPGGAGGSEGRISGARAEEASSRSRGRPRRPR